MGFGEPPVVWLAEDMSKFQASRVMGNKPRRHGGGKSPKTPGKSENT